MTDFAMPGTANATRLRKPDLSPHHIGRRYAAERRFHFYGILAVSLAVLMLALLLVSIVSKGYSAFLQTRVTLDIPFESQVIDPQNTRDPKVLQAADYGALIKAALYSEFPEVTSRADRRALNGLVSGGSARRLMQMVLQDPSIIGTTRPVALLAGANFDMLNKGRITRTGPESERVVSDKQIAWFDMMAAMGRVHFGFNVDFLTSGDSREPEQAGILGALVGSLLTMLTTIVLALPLGVMSAIYLEEFAPKNRLTDIIEVNINNLAAVPSIVFGLLGLAVFLGFFGLPRSAPLVGGLVLSLMTLPTVIIATRTALKAVPPSIREAAYGIGASPLQVVMHHVLPLATPGVMTGAIIGLARALGESAPLLMIGMVAFIVDVPHAVTDPSTVLPVQIFLWADSPERGFIERTSAGIMVLLVFLILMNAAAIIVRRRFERRW
ncbi:MAG: phosphate ABC transporter permease PstA [Dongiaceae bacterium]